MLRTLPALLLGASLLAACSGNKPADKTATDSTATTAALASPLSQAHWLVGSWEFEMPDGKVVETWKMESDSLLSGRVMMTNPKGDSSEVERMELRYTGGKAHYYATVADQNGGQPIAFELATLQEGYFQAVNPTHDYPQKISYQVQGDTALSAMLEGAKPDEAQTFVMKKRPNFR